MPKYLYRYCRWDDRAKLLLLRNRIPLTSPPEFNDPFDCRPPISVDSDWDNISTEVDRWSANMKRRFGNKVIIMPTEHITRTVAAGYRADYEQHVEQVKKRAKVVCFSEVRNSLLMWSHYADSHAGICLRFRVRQDGPLATVQEARYSDKCPVFDPHAHSESDVLEATTLHKSRAWRYEKEWRLIIPDCAYTELAFPKEDLVGIILGARMKPQNKGEVIALLAERSASCTVYESNIDRYRFGITIEPMVRVKKEQKNEAKRVHSIEDPRLR